MLCLGLGLPLVKAAVNENILSEHPRHDYLNVGDIDQLENDLRQALGGLESYSFSRSWWKWDRLRQRYVDGGRRDKNAIRILRAVFRGLTLDWYARCEKRDEGDLFYIFFMQIPFRQKTLISISAIRWRRAIPQVVLKCVLTVSTGGCD